ncbi:hypothetical protein JTB14_023594 [Gonioctena quinquepunctata]|nr:hypothetical protein JTB14_023594 [Gonioctena quinquepunctata]
MMGSRGKNILELCSPSYDLKDSSDEKYVTSGSEYFPASDDEDPEESVSRKQIAYKRNIVKVKWKVFPEKTHNLQKDNQENNQ